MDTQDVRRNKRDMDKKIEYVEKAVEKLRDVVSDEIVVPIADMISEYKGYLSDSVVELCEAHDELSELAEKNGIIVN